MVRKAKAEGAKKAPTIPSMLIDQLLDMPGGPAREAGIQGLSAMFAPQFFPTEKDSGKALSLTVAKLQALIDERAEGREHEELLKSVEIDLDGILSALPEEVTDVLNSDATKRFVLTLRWDATANENKGAYVLAKSIQTARGRKAKATDSADDSDGE